MAHEEQDFVDGWQTYSDWIDVLRTESKILVDYDSNPTFKRKLMGCKSNLERFELIWTNDEIRHELERIFNDDFTRTSIIGQLRAPKSIAESKRRRELGNKSFKDGKFLDALDQYTQAIVYAPYPDNTNNDDSLALALANRSAALYSLTRYRLCLLDIELAMKYGYPKANMFKLMIRKVKCLHILSIWANDVEQIKDELQTMLKSRETKEAVRVEINNMFEFIEQTQPEEVDKDELNVVEEAVMKINNVSKTLPLGADCIEMSYESSKGRYLLTGKDVSFGRLLLAEEPFACNLAPSKRNEYCYNCFGKLYSCGLSCKNCTQILYCSIKCLDEKADTHSYECDKFLDFQEKLGVAYLVPHIMFKINFEYNSVPVHMKKNIENKTLEETLNIPSSDWPDLVFRNNYAGVLSLLDHADDYDYEEIMGYSLTAAYLLVAFRKIYSESRPNLSDEKAQLITGSVILRHLLQLQTNVISILDQNLHDVVAIGHSLSEMKERPIGVGIYPTVSMLNHSCRPNIFSIFHRNKFIARAAKSLECGTEINYCYGPSLTRMSKKDRQKRLKDQYFFSCTCDCCTNNIENECRALVCPKCDGPLIYNQDLTHTCLECHESNLIDVAVVLKKVKDLKLRLGGLQISDSDDCRKLLTIKEIEGELAKILYWKSPIFVQIKSQLIECAENQDDLGSALKYCDEELNLSDKTYGKESFESIMIKLKLINLTWQHLYKQIENSQEKEQKKSAIQELKALLPGVGATKGKLRDLLESTSILGAESSFDAEFKFLADVQNNISKYLVSIEDDSDNPES